MKAPDKIYLHKIRDEESSGFHKMWFEQRARCVPSEEYIRKDALMEWLKERYQQTISNVGCYTGHSVWAEVIEKLESL